ncbi:MAG: glycosyltransferase family 39 protein [Anaerolineales bacterium]|nr:glycosyltransferase family 39 protein [Anaerolineales bacterium]
MWVLILLALAWVVFNAPTDGLWYDETVNAYLATHSWATLWEWSTQIDNQLPLHFVALKLWVAGVGSSEFSLRAFSHLMALLALAGVMALARRLGGSRQAWLSGILFVALGSFLYAATEVRTYALALALLAWSSVFCWELLRKPSRRLMMAYLLTAILLAYTHYTAWLVIGLQVALMALAVIGQRPTTPLTRPQLVLIGGSIGLGIMPWVVALGGRNFNEGTAFEGTVSFRTALETYWNFALWGQKIFNHAATQTSLIIVALVVIAFIVQGHQRWHPYTLYLVALLLVPLAFMTYSSTHIEAKLAGRHTWAMWPSIALLMGGGLAQLPRWAWVRWGAALLVAGVLVTGSHALDEQYMGEFDHVQAILQHKAASTDLLILRDGTLFTAAEYYNFSLRYTGIPADKLTNVNHRVQVHEAWDGFTAQLDTTTQRVWVLSWQGDVMDPTGLAYALPEYFSTGQRRIWLDGETRLVSYDITSDKPNLLEHIIAYPGVVQVPPDGPSLLGYDVLPMLKGPDCGVVVHTWWWRGMTDYPQTMMSVRLVDETGQWLVQVDMPLAGFYFDQSDWQPFIPTLGRVELNAPCAVWNSGQVTMIEMVVYERGDALSGQPIALGTVSR